MEAGGVNSTRSGITGGGSSNGAVDVVSVSYCLARALGEYDAKNCLWASEITWKEFAGFLRGA